MTTEPMRPDEREELEQWQKAKNHDCTKPEYDKHDVYSNETCACCSKSIYGVDGPMPMAENDTGWLCPVCFDKHTELGIFKPSFWANRPKPQWPKDFDVH